MLLKNDSAAISINREICVMCELIASPTIMFHIHGVYLTFSCFTSSQQTYVHYTMKVHLHFRVIGNSVICNHQISIFNRSSSLPFSSI